MTHYPRIARIVLSLALLSVPAAVFSQEEHGTEWQRLNQYFDELTTLRSGFEQTLLDEFGQVVQESQGTLAIQKPGKFRWDYTEPYEQEIVSDGTHFWLYDADLEQVTVRSLDESLQNTPAMLLTGEGKLEDRFTISEAGQRDGVDWITLIPLDSETDFRLVVLSFEGGELVVMELADTLDQVSRIRFFDIERNAEIAAETFLFEPPDGVDVIGDTTSSP